MKLPKITSKQEEILELLYRYRFLNRIQIQALMHHKDYKTINLWLKDLREKQYVAWIYSNHFLEKTKPAIYYLNNNGIRHLKTFEYKGDILIYPLEELHKRYKESQRSRTFIDRSVLIAQCCIELERLNSAGLSNATKEMSVADIATGRDAIKPHYTCITEADYLDQSNDYHFLAEHEPKLRPNVCIVKKKGRSITHYLLEILDPTLPQYKVRSKVKNYVTYLTDNEWEGGGPAPIILLVLPSLYGLIYAKRKVRKLLMNEYYEAEDIPRDLHIRFTATEQLQAQGITATIWEEGRKRLGV